MKKIFTYSAISFFSLVVLLSCSKNVKESLAEPASLNPDKVINAKVAPGETYVLNIANTGGVNIYKQASYYSLSQTGTNENGILIYQYIPAKGFTGADKVLLLHSSETNVSANYNGCNYNSNDMSSRTTLIAVNLTVQ